MISRYDGPRAHAEAPRCHTRAHQAPAPQSSPCENPMQQQPSHPSRQRGPLPPPPRQEPGCPTETAAGIPPSSPRETRDTARCTNPISRDCDRRPQSRWDQIWTIGISPKGSSDSGIRRDSFRGVAIARPEHARRRKLVRRPVGARLDLGDCSSECNPEKRLLHVQDVTEPANRRRAC